MTKSWLFDRRSVAYLLPLLASSKRTRLWIASLNYDNAIELAAKVSGVKIDVGIGGRRKSVKFDKSSHVCLAKLHGSVDWYLPPDGSVQILRGPSESPALIFGSGNKLRIDGPYLDLLFEFRSRLAEHSTLSVCGYSFRDAHVNHVLLSWLDEDKNRSVRVADMSMSKEDLVTNFASALPYGDHVDRRKLADRITLKNIKASKWIAEMSQLRGERPQRALQVTRRRLSRR
jgi:hypothetical protein